MKISRFFLAATLGLALTFTLSCSSDDGGSGGDGDKSHGSYGPGCLVGTFFCMEDKEIGFTEKHCSKEGEEFKPEGCPTNWKVRCIHPSIDYMVIYFYESEEDEAIKAGYRSCTKK